MLGDSVKPIFDAALLQLVDLDHVISPEIHLTPSIGHTPGHLSVLIEPEGAQALITGDMTHHPCQMAHPGWSLGDSNPEAAALTRSRLFGEWAQWAEQEGSCHRHSLPCPCGRPRRLRRRIVQVRGTRTKATMSIGYGIRISPPYRPVADAARSTEGRLRK